MNHHRAIIFAVLLVLANLGAATYWQFNFDIGGETPPILNWTSGQWGRFVGFVLGQVLVTLIAPATAIFAIFWLIRAMKTNKPSILTPLVLLTFVSAAIAGITHFGFMQYATTPDSRNSQYPIISRCMLVYGAVFESGKALQDQALFIYGQKRLAWVGGFYQSVSENPEFQRVFQSDGDRNKALGMRVEAELVNAVRARNAAAYNEIMRYPRQCDVELELPTHDMPSMVTQ